MDRVVGQRSISTRMTAGQPAQKRSRSRRSKFCSGTAEFYLILATSGSEGWHLFVFSAEFHPVEHWVRLLKQVADKIGAEIKTGICEIFPNETRNRSRPHAIRAPGTWNPKTNQLGAIFFESITPLLQKKRKKEVSSFLYHSSSEANADQLNDRESVLLLLWRTSELARGSLLSPSRGPGMRSFGLLCTAFFARSDIESPVGTPMRSIKPHDSSRMLRSQSTWKNLKNSGIG